MKTYKILFSPTGGTAKVASILTERFAQKKNLPIETIDLTDATADFSRYALAADDVAFIAMPVYSGRVPAVAVERLRRIRPGGARCAVVAVFGNRDYEDALIELYDAALACGFLPIAAIAAVAEHSIMHCYATGRPDDADTFTLDMMARTMWEKLDMGNDRPPLLPGNRPYREAKPAALIPQADSACNRCGRCAALCPVGAIPSDDPATTLREVCIGCMRCIAVCPRHARSVDARLVEAAASAMHKAFATRKKNEMFG